MQKKGINLWQLFFVLVLISGVLYFGDRRGWWDEARGRAEEALRAFKVQSSRLKAQWLEEKIREPLNQRTIELEAKILSLEEKVWQLESENKDLRRQLQAPLAPSFKFVPAKVIGFKCQVSSIKCQEKELLLSVGKDQGLEAGMAVVLEDILLGKISQVTPRLSRVQLLTALESRVTVKTEGGGRGIIMGNFKFQNPNDKSISNSKIQILNSVLLDRVLQGEALEAGEKVLTSGEDGLPPDLLIGKVVKVISEEREPFKKGVVELFVEPKEIERVFVIKN